MSAVYLMRHGQLPPNPERRFIGQRDIPLAEAGREQARAWQRELARIPLAAIVSSDLSRCLETAEIIGGTRNIPLFPEPAFREISLGAWEGATRAEIEQRFPGAYSERGRDLAGFRPQNGESFHDLAQRVLPAYDAWAAAFHKPLLIVAHAGVNRTILARYMAIPPQDILNISQPYGCCAVMC